jgi:hypothetical protein
MHCHNLPRRFSLTNPDILIRIISSNFLDALRRLLNAEIAQHVETFEQRRGPKTTGAILEASYTAARRNHHAALNILLDSGCPIMHGV